VAGWTSYCGGARGRLDVLLLLLVLQVVSMAMLQQWLLFNGLLAKMALLLQAPSLLLL
jgi:hypothetical protein